jgi:thiol-disulfide isomerase/thioredoxin
MTLRLGALGLITALAILSLAALWLVAAAAQAGVGIPAPEIAAKTWLNSEPKTIGELKGKVVLVEFWTFGCYNCQNVEPFIKQWHQKYAGQGLVIVGVHSPEFGYERVLSNVQRYIRDHGIQYAVAIDNDFAIWKRYQNRYWPAMYLIDKRGVIRYRRFGEGGYAQTEQQIQELIAEPERHAK